MDKDNFERYLELKAEYDQKKAAIKENTRLSAEGKKEALKELAVYYLDVFKGMLAAIDDQSEQLKEKIEQLEAEGPGWDNLSEKELLAERRQVELMLGQLSAAGRDNFLKTAEAAAAMKQPGVFKVAFSQVADLAEKLFPSSMAASSSGGYDPWNPGAGQQGEVVDQDGRKRAYVFAELQGLYEKATAATVTPEDKQRQQEIEALKGQRAGLPWSISGRIYRNWKKWRSF